LDPDPKKPLKVDINFLMSFQRCKKKHVRIQEPEQSIKMKQKDKQAKSRTQQHNILIVDRKKNAEFKWTNSKYIKKKL